MAATGSTTIQKILDIQVNYNQAIRGIAEYNRQLQEAAQYEKQLAASKKSGAISEDEYRVRMAASRQEVMQISNAKRLLEKTTRNQITAQREEEGSLVQLRAKLSEATQAYDSLSAAERNGAKGKALQEHINAITSDLKEAEQQTQRFYRNVGNYQDAVNGLQKMETSVASLGKQFLALAGITSLGALSKKAQEVGTAYADQMGKVRAVTNANAVEFAQMSQEVERLGSTTRYTAQEAGEAMEFLTRNGLSAVAATGTLEGVLHLAQANAIELGEAADIVTGQMNAFHLKVQDVTRINDVLSYTCANSATDIHMLNEALRNTAPIAYTSGVSIEETCAALATLADNNIKGADAGTILKQAFNGMITSTQKSKKAYDELGVSMDISVVKSEGFIGSLQKIMDASPSVQQLSDIFGRRAVPGVLALTNSMDMLGEKFKNISENAAGTADRMFEQSYSKFTVAAKSLESAWEGFLIQVWQGTNQELRDRFVAEGEKLDQAFTPRIDAVKEKLKELNEEFQKDPTNEALLNEINTVNGELGNVSREYAMAKQNLSQQMEVENTGNQDLINRWKEGANAIDQNYLPKIDEIKARVASLGEELKKDPTNAAVQEELNNAGAQLNAAYEAYAGARQEFQNSMSEEIAENTDGGLASMIQGPIEMLTEAIQYIKTNIEELGMLMASVIGGFSLTKLINHVRESAGTMRATLVSNAEAATARVNQLTQQGSTQRSNIRRLEAQQQVAIENGSVAEQQLIANKLTIEKAKLAETEKSITRAKTTEIKVMEEAAAVSTATGWKGAMVAAGIAVKGFVTTAKTAMKSFAPMLVISLVIELVMKLWDALNSGKGPIGNIGKAIGSFIKNGLQKLMQVIVDVINWFIEFYNDSIVVRAGIAYLGGVFKAVWAILKAGIRGIGNSFKLLGGIIAGVANTLKSLFTLDFSGVKAGIAQIGTAVTNFYKNQVDNAKEAGNEIVDGFVSSFEGLDQKLEKVSLKAPASGDKPSGGGRAGGTNSGGGAGMVNADDLGGGGGSATGGKGGRGKRGGRGGNDADKEKREAEKREKELNKVYEEAEKELQKLTLELMGETADKRKQKIIDQYNNEKKTIEQKLAETKKLLEDPKLTADQRKLAEEAVKSWEAALAKIPDAQKKALDLWEMEEKDRQAKLQQELAKAELDNIKVNGEEQLNRRLELQKEQQKQQELMEENALKKRLMSAEITEEQYNKLLTQLKEKHRQQEKQLEEKHTQDLNALRKKALQDRINAIKASQSEEEAVRFLARTKALYGSEEFYQAELNRLKGAKKEELTATYEAATSRLEQLRTEGNERLAAIDEQGRLEEETEAEFQARRKAAMDEYMSSRMATDTEFATQVQEADKALAQARLDIDNAMIEQQLANLSDKEAALLRAQYDSASQSLQMLEERGKLENQTQAEYDAELVAAKQEKLNAIIKINDAQVKNEQAKAQAMKAVTQSLTQLLDQLGDENSAFAKLSKIITLAQIAIDTGRALSAGIASASSLPFPANLAAIATTVATILANVATAISTVKSAKFATGGKVSGPGTGTSDSIPAMLSNGEFVVNARSTALFEPLLTAMNNIGRGIPMQVANSYQPVSSAEMMTASFSEAAQEIRPVVSVVDVTDMQNKVEVIQNLDTF